MKLLLSLACLAVTGISAQASAPLVATPVPSPSSTGDESSCKAEYIVTRCLQTENAKAASCKATDYDCQCAAYQAIATCYNNCPNDPRASSAQNQVTVFCQQASLYGSSALASKTAATASTGQSTQVLETAATSATASVTLLSSSNTATFSSDNPMNTGAANEMVVRNTGGVLMAVAGVVAALL